MRIYLMARYSRHPEMQVIAKQLETLGHTVTSRWIWGAHQADDAAIATGRLGALEQRFALEDIADLHDADLCIGFSEPLRTPSRGGRHVELGLAIAWRKHIVVVGGAEHVFHAVPEIRHFATVAMLYDYMAARQQQEVS